MNILADLPTRAGYQHTAAATTKKYIREHPDIVRRYVKSQLEAVHRIYTDKNAAIRALARFIGRSLSIETFWKRPRENLLNEAVLPKKQYPSLEGIKTILATELKRQARQARRLCRFHALSENSIRAASPTDYTKNVRPKNRPLERGGS